jgi:hypothetical protein
MSRQAGQIPAYESFPGGAITCPGKPECPRRDYTEWCKGRTCIHNHCDAFRVAQNAARKRKPKSST